MVKKLPANAVDVREVGSIPGSGRSPGGGHGNPLQYSCLENPMDRGAWRANVHSIGESDMTTIQHTHSVNHHKSSYCMSLYNCPSSPISVTTEACSLLVNINLFSVSMSLFCFHFVCLFLFFRFHILVKSHSICISTSDLFHLAEYLHSPSMLLQMTGFHSLFFGG